MAFDLPSETRATYKTAEMVACGSDAAANPRMISKLLTRWLRDRGADEERS